MRWESADSSEEVVEKYKTEWSKSENPNGPLFHYSSCDGGMGIIRNGGLWSSSFECMNDQEEFRHGMEQWKQPCLNFITFVSTAKGIDPLHGPIRFRSRQSTLVDFIELKLVGVSGIISGCRLGPKTRAESHFSWRQLLSTSGYNSNLLSFSNVAVGRDTEVGT